MKRVTTGIGDAFKPVEACRRCSRDWSMAYWSEGSPACQRNRRNWPFLTPTGNLVAALRGQVEFRTADHSACLQEGQTAVWRRGQRRAEEALTATLEGALVLHAHRLQRATKTGAWMTVQPSTVNETELGEQEWHDNLFLR